MASAPDAWWTYVTDGGALTVALASSAIFVLGGLAIVMNPEPTAASLVLLVSWIMTTSWGYVYGAARVRQRHPNIEQPNTKFL